MNRLQIELTYNNAAPSPSEAKQQAQELSKQLKVNVLVRLEDEEILVKYNEENDIDKSLFNPVTNGSLSIHYFPVYSPGLNTRAVIVAVYKEFGDDNGLSLEQWNEAVKEVKDKLGDSEDRKFPVFWDIGFFGAMSDRLVQKDLNEVVDGFVCRSNQISRSLSGSVIDASWEVYKSISQYQKPGGKKGTRYSFNHVQKHVEHLDCWLDPTQY